MSGGSGPVSVRALLQLECHMERADLIAAVLTGMRRAEDFRARASIYSTAHSQQMEVDHGKAAMPSRYCRCLRSLPSTSNCWVPPASKTLANRLPRVGLERRQQRGADRLVPQTHECPRWPDPCRDGAHRQSPGVAVGATATTGMGTAALCLMADRQRPPGRYGVGGAVRRV